MLERCGRRTHLERVVFTANLPLGCPSAAAASAPGAAFLDARAVLEVLWHLPQVPIALGLFRERFIVLQDVRIGLVLLEKLLHRPAAVTK